jgi:exodeoxyribonuclease VII large subunit
MAATGTAGAELAVPKGIALSQLMKGVASAVAQAYRSGVWTRVEVSRADTRCGHVYLELAERDAQGAAVAQARAMIWASTAATILPRFEQATSVVLAAGIKLLVRAKPTVHAVYGLSLEIDAIDPEYTLGDLEARKREIRERLQREGVFDANRHLPPPWDFNAVLVVAPEGAAGLGDFHAEAQRLRRFGVCRFVYAHSRFQGEGAPALIRSALLHALDDWEPGALPDAVVIIRGGGAVNDLAWLNDYALARCICDLDVPVLTGIGHERDSTVLDEVAHRRFDTPSKVIAGIEQLIAQRAWRAREHFEFALHTARHQLQQARQETAHAPSARAPAGRAVHPTWFGAVTLAAGRGAAPGRCPHGRRAPGGTAPARGRAGPGATRAAHRSHRGASQPGRRARTHHRAGRPGPRQRRPSHGRGCQRRTPDAV